MEVSEIKQRFNRFEQCVEKAMLACQHDAAISPQLADSIRDLDHAVHAAHNKVATAQRDTDLIACIDRLEEMGDNAREACQAASGISQATQNAVLDVHREISALKHKLH